MNGGSNAKRPTEATWVRQVIEELRSGIEALSTTDTRTEVTSGEKLAYRQEVFSYEADRPAKVSPMRYETDILVRDCLDNNRKCWIPRVVIECKLSHVTTHDAITYSNKADTHKTVHPYLRYGILIGSHGAQGVPRRLFRHGAFFDFMAAWSGEQPTDRERGGFIEVIREEVETSRRIEKLVAGRQSAGRRYSLVHRPLRLINL